MRRGDLYLAKLASGSRGKEASYRPVILLSSDGFNQTPAWRPIIVVPVSSFEAQARSGPTAIFLAMGTGGLEKDSVALCHQLTALNRAKLTRCLGQLPAKELKEIEAGIKAALALD